MPDRQATPDIKSDLICKSDKQKRNKAIKKKPAFVYKPIKPSNNKATFNLSKKILDRLENCWKEIRSLTESKQISRNLLVEKALELALQDFHTKKQVSWLYDKTDSNKTII